MKTVQCAAHLQPATVHLVIGRYANHKEITVLLWSGGKILLMLLAQLHRGTAAPHCGAPPSGERQVAPSNRVSVCVAARAHISTVAVTIAAVASAIGLGVGRGRWGRGSALPRVTLQEQAELQCAERARARASNSFGPTVRSEVVTRSGRRIDHAVCLAAFGRMSRRAWLGPRPRLGPASAKGSPAPTPAPTLEPATMCCVRASLNTHIDVGVTA